MIRHAGSSGGAVAVLAALAVVAFCPAAALAGGQDCRDAVPVGETPTVSGSVSGTAPVYYRFEVAASALYRVYSSGDTDTVGQLLNADCRVISEDDDGGQGLNFLIERELEPGTHYVAVRGYNAAASGPYTLHVETGPGGPNGGSGCYDAEPMPPGGTVSGTVRGTAWRFFSFTLSSPSAVTIITEGPTDTIGQLLDADCNRIVDDDDGGEGTNFRIETELEPGAYYVAVRGYNDATSGPYTLRVGLPGGARQGGGGGGSGECRDAIPIYLNQSVTGRTAPDTYNLLTFQAPEAAEYRIYTTGSTDTVGLLLDSACSQIGGDDDSGEGNNFLIAMELEPGQYYVAVGGYGNTTTGPYALRVEADRPVTLAGCRDAQPLTLDSEAQISVEGARERFYSFQVPAIGSYRIATIGELDTVGALLDAGCNLLTVDDDGGLDSNFWIEVCLAPGTYYVSVRGFDEGTSGTAGLLVRPGGGSGGLEFQTALDIGASPVASGVVSGSDFRYYALSIAAAGRYMIYSSGPTDTVGALYDAGRQELAEDDDGGGDYNFLIERDLQPGDYYVGVRGYGEATTGRVILNIVDRAGFDNARSAQTGVDITGSVRGWNPLFCRFEAATAGRYMAYSTGPVDVVGELFDGDCRPIADDDDSGEDNNFMIGRELTPGTYYIGVRGYAESTAGDFTLRIVPEAAGGAGCADAPSISLGQRVPGYLEGTARRFYGFEVTTTGQYRVFTSGATDTIGELLDSSCNLIAEDDDGGTDLNFLIARDLSPGAYYASVRGYDENSAGSYMLLVRSGGGGADCAGAVSVAPGQALAGTLEGTVPQFYRFQTFAAGTYRLYTTGSLDTVGQLLDEDCRGIGEDDDTGEGLNFMMIRLLSPGAYYISVRGYGEDARGDFTIFIERSDGD